MATIGSLVHSRAEALFDQQLVSFVSITQSFNTTSSMGRLTLNVPAKASHKVIQKGLDFCWEQSVTSPAS